MNELLLSLARWVDAHDWSTQIHESIYLYSWIEGTHVLTLTLFLGMLVIIDLRMIGKTFTHIPADKLAARLNRPMFIGFVVMVISGSLLYYAIPVRTTQSIWFRIKVVLLITAGINAWLFHRAMQASVDTWSKDETPPPRIRRGAATSLISGRASGSWATILNTTFRSVLSSAWLRISRSGRLATTSAR